MCCLQWLYFYIFALFISHATDVLYPLWHDKRLCCLPTAALSLLVSTPCSLSPASSPLLFTHMTIKSVTQRCDPLQHFVLFFFLVVVVVFLFLCFSPLLPPSCGFLSWVSRSRLGAEEREEEGRGGGGYICSFMTNHMCFWVLVFTCFSWKEGGGTGWRERKDEHMVLVCWVKFRLELFVSCDEQRETHSHNYPQIWLLHRQEDFDFSLK